MTDWVPPDVYPYVEAEPTARCWLWMHGKAIVRFIVRNGVPMERYDCRCGKFYWLSQADGRRPLVRHRNQVAAVA